MAVKTGTTTASAVLYSVGKGNKGYVIESYKNEMSRVSTVHQCAVQQRDTAENYRRSMQQFIGNQEALTFPRPACSSLQGNPVQRPLSYAADPQLWVAITKDLD